MVTKIADFLPGSRPPRPNQPVGLAVGTPDDRRNAAVQHILAIRANYGLDQSTRTPESLVKTAESGCEVLAEHLYQKSTHFLLELIQNADDNTYSVDTPTLQFTYTKGYLRIDSNETGFTSKDVDALCNLGQSSKSGIGASTNFVGEKGIGFKSVFKVAEQVWVSSGQYEFKFDKSKRLGMIAPILEDFPAQKREGWTSFYLKLSGNEGGLREELLGPRGVNAELLLFLRKLRKLVVVIQNPSDGTFETRTLRREDGQVAGREAKHLYMDNHKLGNYLFMRHNVRRLPPDPKRPGATAAEIVLAFPLDDNNNPRLQPQPVCAFLPIRDYGLRFLVQADFLLIASREDVDTSAAWNRALRGACIAAFDDCVRWFNNSTFKFVWPRFLPSFPTSYDFFSPLKTGLLDHLCKVAILSDLNGTMRRPCDLVYVPRTFRDDSGKPLTASSFHDATYLSLDYKDEDYRYFKRLGVKRMDQGMFLAHLQSVISCQDFALKPDAWHSRLAAVLADVYEASSSKDFSFKKADLDQYDSDDDHKHNRPLKANYKLKNPFRSAKGVVEDLPIIPLRDGRWVPGTTAHVFFPGTSGSWGMPGGLGFLVIEPRVSQDSRRANLYRLLGAKDFDPTEISQVIMDTHASKDFDPRTVSRGDLVSQIKFLYTAGWRRTVDGPYFWFVTECDARARAHVLYMDADEPLSATKIFAGKRDVFEFIHSDYYNALDQDDDNYGFWLGWLKQYMRLTTAPRLARIVGRTSNGDGVSQTAPELEYIIRKYGTLGVLKIVCRHWDRYLRFVLFDSADSDDEEEDDATDVPDLAVQVPNTALGRRIASLKVPCTDGVERPLQDTFLPLMNVPPETEGCVPFVALRDPDNPHWLRLGWFGVGIKQDLSFYLRCVKSFSRTPGSLDKITFFYEQLQARSSEDISKLRKFFSGRDELVYVPCSVDAKQDPDDGFWTSLDRCLWDGPACLRGHFCLSRVYPSCKKLFFEILKVGDAAVQDIVRETTLFSTADELSYIRKVFFEIEKCIENDIKDARELGTIQGSAVIPVTRKGNAEGLTETFEMLQTPQSEIFIADTRPLLQSFAGLIPLVALSIDDTAQMKRLIYGLGMEEKRLSRAAESLPRTHGRVQFDQSQTDWFQSRYQFMSRLVEPSKVDPNRRKRVLAALQNIEVFSAQNVVQGYRVKLGSNFVEGRERPGKVVLSPGGDSFKIYLKEKYLEQEKNPYELVEQLAEWTGIKEYKDGPWLLHIILTEHSHDRIASILDERGVPSKFDEEETDDSWLNKKAKKTEVRAPKSRAEGFAVITAENLASMLGWTADEGRNAHQANVGPNPWADVTGFRLVGGSAHRKTGMSAPPEPEYDAALEFEGQLFFSNELSKILGDKYNPEAHWTSPLRTIAGLPEYSGPDEQCAFTVNDAECGAAWTQAIAAAGYPEARLWLSRPPTWHIEVKTVATLQDEFVLSEAHFEVARRHCIAHQNKRAGRSPTDAMMLVIVFDVKTEGETKFNMFPDPWNLYENGLLMLRPTSNFIGKLATTGS